MGTPSFSSRILAGIFITSMSVAGISPAYAETNPTLSDAVITVDTTDLAQTVQTIESSGGTVTSTFPELGTIIADIPTSTANALGTQAGVDVNKELIIEQADTIVPNSWGLDRIDQQDLPLDNLYNIPASENGSGTVIYFVDSGIRSDHQEFTGRLLTGWDGVNDGMGTEDCTGHGTHVAGTAAGNTSGVAPGALLMPIRIFTCAGAIGSAEGFYGGLQHIIDDHDARGGSGVVNMSITGPAQDGLDNAVQILINAGLTVVVAAGNDNEDACLHSPARVADALTIASSNSGDSRSSFSNYGTCADIFAPGSGIQSSSKNGASAYELMSGTSMATPHAAGVAARLYSANPTATPADITSTIIATAANNKLINTNGTVNKLLQIQPSTTSVVAAAPTNTSAQTYTTDIATGMVGANITWTAPTNPTDAPVTGYNVTVYPSTGVTGATTRSAGNVTNYAFSGLTLGVDYTFTVTAVNRIGESLPSVGVAFKEVGPPSQVSKLSAAAQGYQAVRVWIAAPTYLNGGTVSSYTITATPQTGSSPVRSVSVASGTTAATVSNLTAGVKYTITAHAVTEQGSGVSRTAGTGVTAWGKPSAPRNVAASYPAALKTWVSWTIPETTYYAPLVRYEIRWTTAAGTSSWSNWTSTGYSRGYTINGLPKNQTRYVEVRMVSAGGTGAISRITVIPKN